MLKHWLAASAICPHPAFLPSCNMPRRPCLKTGYWLLGSCQKFTFMLNWPTNFGSSVLGIVVLYVSQNVAESLFPPVFEVFLVSLALKQDKISYPVEVITASPRPLSAWDATPTSVTARRLRRKKKLFSCISLVTLSHIHVGGRKRKEPTALARRCEQSRDTGRSRSWNRSGAKKHAGSPRRS